MITSEWITNLFQAEQTRGLSGARAGDFALYESNPYYNYRLRWHSVRGDLVADPNLLWNADPNKPGDGGLVAHIQSDASEASLAFTDVLLILSLDDYAKLASPSDGPGLQQASSALKQAFYAYCRLANKQPRIPHRPIGFRFVCDGSADMGGHVLGLTAGEYVTGLLPNLYTGPVADSKWVATLYLHLPGFWEGYREVSRVYNDQILFTIGNSFLDNFSHEALREAAIYRLYRRSNGQFIHVVSPDLQDRYQLEVTEQEQFTVLSLGLRRGEAIAHWVLLDANTSPNDVQFERNLYENEPDRSFRSILPEVPSERIFTLQERGALLQKVHFSQFMLGYDVYLGQRGEIGTAVENPVVAVQVRKRHVAILPYVTGVILDGQVLARGKAVTIEGHVTIGIDGQLFEYRDLRGVRAERWPYVGEIRRPASSNYLVWGDRYIIGRSPTCRVVLPDETNNDNIVWKSTVDDDTAIRARTGQIPKTNFYTDSIMVASEHAAISLRADYPAVESRARHCFVYVRRAGEPLVLYPTTSGKGPTRMPLQPGDDLLVGNCLFRIGFTPSGEGSSTTLQRTKMNPHQALSWFAPLFTLPKTLVNVPETSSQAPEDAVFSAGLRDRSLGHTSSDNSQFAAPHGIAKELVEPTEPVDPNADAEAIAEPHAKAAEPVTEAAEPHAKGSAPEEPLGEPGTGFEDGEFDFPMQLLPEEEREASAEAATEAVTTSQGEAIAYTSESAPEGAEPAAEVAPPEGEGSPVEDAASEDEPSTSEGAEASGSDGDAMVEPNASRVEDFTPVVEDFTPVVEDTESPSESSEPGSDASLGEPGTGFEDGEFDFPMQLLPEEEREASAEAATEAATTSQGEAHPAATALASESAPEGATPDAEVAEPHAEGLTSGSENAESDASFGEVVVVEDENAQFELGRTTQVVQVGFMVVGRLVCGNHTTADLCIPENRIEAAQRFRPVNYFEVHVRGRRTQLQVLTPQEMRINGVTPQQDPYTELSELTLEVIRRDDRGDEDFAVQLDWSHPLRLPNPRAHFLAIRYDDDLAAALITRGLPTGDSRELTLDGLTATFRETNGTVHITDYLDAYRTTEGYRPFFVQHSGDRFVTAPENGEPIALTEGDLFVIGHSVYTLRIR